MFCVNCGSKVEDSWKFCNNCGQPVQAASAPAAQSSAQQSGKKYVVEQFEYDKLSEYREIQRGAGLRLGFYGNNFIVLEDGTQIGFVYGHIAKYQGAEDFTYNLYKVTPDKNATFLGGGIRGNIESFYIQNGVAYCEYCNDTMKIKID